MGKNFSFFPSLPSSVASQSLWHNKYIKIDDKTIFSSSLSAKGINFVGQLFQNNQQIKKWDELKTEFDLIKNEKFLTVQIIHALPTFCEKKFYEISLKVLIILLSRIITWLKHQILSLNKLNSTTLYEILIDANNIQPTFHT